MKGIGPLKPVSRTTLSEQVARQLATELAAKRWKAGDKLPSEAELCRVFNVGRSTLREALKSLAFVGLIRMRAGGGSYVAEAPSAYSNPRLLPNIAATKNDLRDLWETRLVLETELVSLCAQRATRSDLATLKNLVRKMDAARSEDAIRFQQLDVDFHFSVAAGSKNKVLAQLLSNVRTALQQLLRRDGLSASNMKLACEQHQKILSALEQRDPGKARQAIRAHLAAFQKTYAPLPPKSSYRIAASVGAGA